jgi:hypothetical protein
MEDGRRRGRRVWLVVEVVGEQRKELGVGGRWSVSRGQEG